MPGYLADAPDVALEQMWATTGWFNIDSALSARDKVLVAFGAAAATHCEY